MPFCICTPPPVAEEKVEESPAPRAAAPAKKAAAPAKAGGSAAPSFFVHSSTKTYASDGEGLREAIKAGDLAGVRQVLRQDASTANYEDRQGQSMLHLAAIFNNADIAVALIQAGGAVSKANGQGESPLDLAPPALANKMRAAVAARSA